MSTVPRMTPEKYRAQLADRNGGNSPQIEQLARVIADWADAAGPVTPADESLAKHILREYGRTA